jgi:hypothetical protein
LLTVASVRSGMGRATRPSRRAAGSSRPTGPRPLGSART